MDLESLVNKYDLDIRGVIHVGANNGGEYPIYKKLGIKDMVFFEPHPAAFEMLLNTVGDDEGTVCINAAAGNFSGRAKMYEANNRFQSSSLLEPLKHLFIYPWVKFRCTVDVDVVMLDMVDVEGDYNFLSIDTQGYELEVLKGAEETLGDIDYILCEVYRDELYSGCPLVREIDDLLNNFKRVKTDWAGITWGDALYIRK